MSIFKSCDVRGIYNDDLTPAFASDLGQAIGTALAGGSVVVGGDARLSTPRLKGALIEGLLGSGCHVTDIGLVPTSALYFAQGWLQCDGAVMVTASHNPPGYNGFKLQLGQQPISEADLLALQARIESRDFRQGQGYWSQAKPVEAYRDHIEHFFEAGTDLRVIVDAGNGCLSDIAPETLRRTGYTVSERFCRIDGRFPNRDPNPAVAAHLTALVEQVVAEQADVGVAYDGDGDRVIFVDDLGRILAGDRALALFIRHRLPAAQTDSERTVIYDIKCSSIVAKEIDRWGGNGCMERSGYAFIKRSLLQKQAGLGGEISGHYFFGELGRDDALFATLLMLQILSQTSQPLSALIDDIPHYPITPDLRLPCLSAERTSILAQLRSTFADRQISTVDGVRITFDGGWALARPSVTEPLITLRFEGQTEARLQEIQAEVAQRVPTLGQLLNRYKKNYKEKINAR